MAPEGSTGRGSGSKTSQKTGPQLKDSSEDWESLGTSSGPLGTRGVTYLLHHGSSLFVAIGWVYVFVA